MMKITHCTFKDFNLNQMPATWPFLKQSLTFGGVAERQSQQRQCVWGGKRWHHWWTSCHCTQNGKGFRWEQESSFNVTPTTSQSKRLSVTEVGATGWFSRWKVTLWCVPHRDNGVALEWRGHRDCVRGMLKTPVWWALLARRRRLFLTPTAGVLSGGAALGEPSAPCLQKTPQPGDHEWKTALRRHSIIFTFLLLSGLFIFAFAIC